MRLFKIKGKPSIVDERKEAAKRYIDMLDHVDMVWATGHRLPDGRTEIHVEVVGFTAPEPWLVQHFQEHPSTVDHPPPVTPPVS